MLVLFYCSTLAWIFFCFDFTECLISRLYRLQILIALSLSYICHYSPYVYSSRPPLWSEFLATVPDIRVRFPALQEFLRNSGSGTGSTQPHEYNWGAAWKKRQWLRSRKPRIRQKKSVTLLYPQKLALASPTFGCRSVDIVHSRTQATEFFFSLRVQLQVTFRLYLICLVFPSYPICI
jgi:hypothetical protein